MVVWACGECLVASEAAAVVVCGLLCTLVLLALLTWVQESGDR